MTAFKLQAEKQQILLILDSDFRGPPEHLSLSLALSGAEAVRRALALDSARTNGTRGSRAGSVGGGIPRITSHMSEFQQSSVRASEMHASASREHFDPASCRSSFDTTNGPGPTSTPTPTPPPMGIITEAMEARLALTRHDRIGRGIGPDDCANIDVHKFGQVVRTSCLS